ncbi:porin family protein [Robertkochia solimangrovi]|uniref:porin family protein n=1 Tax=Robertkochia solimangrovi TaxID=2213046 RepID=UPI00117C255E|nr:porin family protein [Robertkochia solimangrovi]TRZ45161.1 PorT family protein [Robertkochia solimangrovi]
MKKVILAFVLIAGSVITANAQFVKLGVKGGANFADITGDNTESIDMRTSFHIGGVAELIMSDSFSFQPEVIYSSQGGKQSYGDTDVTLKLDYINVPFMAKIYPVKGLSLEVGPQVGFLINDSVEFDGEDLSAEYEISDDLREVDFGANFGLGYKFDNGFFLNGRYNLGLANLIDDDSDNKIHNGVIQVSAGFFF